MQHVISGTRLASLAFLVCIVFAPSQARAQICDWGLCSDICTPQVACTTPCFESSPSCNYINCCQWGVCCYANWVEISRTINGYFQEINPLWFECWRRDHIVYRDLNGCFSGDRTLCDEVFMGNHSGFECCAGLYSPCDETECDGLESPHACYDPGGGGDDLSPLASQSAGRLMGPPVGTDSIRAGCIRVADLPVSRYGPAAPRPDTPGVGLGSDARLFSENNPAGHGERPYCSQDSSEK